MFSGVVFVLKLPAFGSSDESFQDFCAFDLVWKLSFRGEKVLCVHRECLSILGQLNLRLRQKLLGGADETEL